VFINYNPWDGGTGREQGTDEDMLETLVDGLGIDGVFLDTMHGDELPDLHARLARIRPDIVLCPEGAPPLEAMPHCDASWAQGQLDDPAYSPSLILRKWLEPAHMTWQIWRWQTDHREEIRRAFFNGTGMLVWENVFGVHNPWSPTDRHLWRRAVRILRFFQTHFASDAWDPYIPSGLTPERLARLGWQAHEVPEVRVHRRPGDRGTVYTFSAKGFHHEHGLHFHHTQWPLLELPDKPGMAYFDLWNGRTMTPRQDAPGTVCLWGRLDHNSGLGCILAVPESQVDDALLALIAAQSAAAAEMPAATPDRDRVLDTTAPVVPDLRRRSDRPEPAGMVRVAGGPVHVRLDHPRRECGCYPDPGTPRDLRQAYTWGSPFTGRVSHDFEVEVEAFWIDECEVSNADFERFLAESGYVPTEPRNFLKHWTDGRMPAEVAELPVVFVDLDDARAYARWAGKRLPTEWEWQVAAQGRDGRAWPWGDEFDPERCAPDHGPVPVRSMPRGRSPWGCYHMAGNVWEWTESCRDDGHTRFAMIRGGSWYRAEGSGWYVEGGPQPCTSHTKFIRMWPGLDRCATVGFRCAMDDGPGVVPADR
jgi:formylglycine-generating enzyme required for sulfatase activity